MFTQAIAAQLAGHLAVELDALPPALAVPATAVLGRLRRLLAAALETVGSAEQARATVVTGCIAPMAVETAGIAPGGPGTADRAPESGTAEPDRRRPRATSVLPGFGLGQRAASRRTISRA